MKPSQDWLDQNSYPYDQFVEVWISYMDNIVVQLSQDGMPCKLLEYSTTSYHRSLHFKLRIKNGLEPHTIGTDLDIIIPYEDCFPRNENYYPSGDFKVIVDTFDSLYCQEEWFFVFNDANVSKQVYQVLYFAVAQAKNDNLRKYRNQLHNLKKYYHKYLEVEKREAYEKRLYLEHMDRTKETSFYNEFLAKLLASVGSKLRK